jgi:filamentous hemagglutinin
MPMNVEALAAGLESRGLGDWTGAFVAEPEQALDTLVSQGEPWSAVMFPRDAGGDNSLLHFVVVDGEDNFGRIRIRDPWEGSAYTMTREGFLHFWTSGAVYRAG